MLLLQFDPIFEDLQIGKNFQEVKTGWWCVHREEPNGQAIVGYDYFYEAGKSLQVVEELSALLLLVLGLAPIPVLPPSPPARTH